MSAFEVSLGGLLPALRRLDRLLEGAIDAAEAVHGPGAASDPYRGLYVSSDEMERLLAREPGVPTLWIGASAFDDGSPELAGEGTRLAWLASTYNLSLFDLDVILIALAPEIDLRYERLYAYLQDDVTRRRPTVDLALNLLCSSADERLAQRVHFAPEAPLVHHGLLHLLPDPNHPQPPLLAHYLKLDDQITRFLLGQSGLDPRLVPCGELVEPADSLESLPLSAERKRALSASVVEAWTGGWPLSLYFHGLPGAGKRRTAEALAGEIGAPLLAVDLSQAVAAGVNFQQTLRLAFREAWFADALLYLDGVDALLDDEGATRRTQLLDALAQSDGVTIMGGTAPWVPSFRHPIGVLAIPFPIPGFMEQRDCWEAELTAASVAPGEHDLVALAGRFRLTPGQVSEAVAVACNRAHWRAATQPETGDFYAAARAQSGHDLAALACKIEPIYTWDDIVLPDDTLAQLHEICQRVARRHHVLGEWGFDRKLSLGKGVTALFAGPSGTGKTMSAEIIAGELQLDLYKIDLSGVVSKYIGETEKNLDRIFAAAENANAILLFDEADALFGKRSEVRDSHDRYANIEISYLLQKMEEYDGTAILSTNLRHNLDESFVRRLAFTVYFPFPDEESRRRIWAGIWPEQTPLAGDVDLDDLARRFRLSGGNIKNVALAGAYLASADGGTVTMDHLFHATRREYQKMGKALSEAELGSTGDDVIGIG